MIIGSGEKAHLSLKYIFSNFERFFNSLEYLDTRDKYTFDAQTTIFFTLYTINYHICYISPFNY